MIIIIYYYKPQKGSRGRKPSEKTLLIKGKDVEAFPNSKVVEQIKETQKDPDTNYGYRKMTYSLMIQGYTINHKKVYRLMFENHLLKEKIKKGERNFVKYRKAMPLAPLELLEMDIKFIWVEEHRRQAYVITVIDTFTRVVLHWQVAYQIKQEQVKKLWEHIIQTYLQPYNCIGKNMKIEIRNDNDSRFLAKTVQRFFAENDLNQVFTHPYTPQENGHIESFHAILSQKVKQYNFWNMDELEQCLILFYEKYNNHRLHSSTLFLPPMVFWNCWENGLIQTEKNEKKQILKHKLKIPYHELSGNMNLREVPCSQSKTLDGFEIEPLKEMNGAETFLQPSV